MNQHLKDGPTPHEEAWLLLPWLANGRLSGASATRALQHVRGCTACSEELFLQRRLCEALAGPTIARPVDGSLGELMRRIDEAAPSPVEQSFPPAQGRGWGHLRQLGSPQRLAWAAGILLVFGMGAGLLQHATAPLYQVHSDARPAGSAVLHVAFARDLTVDQMQALLAADHAQVIEGPGSTGLFGIVPAEGGGEVHQRLKGLAAQLRSDPRVRWVEPIPADTGSSPSSGTP